MTFDHGEIVRHNAEPAVGIRSVTFDTDYTDMRSFRPLADGDVAVVMFDGSEGVIHDCTAGMIEPYRVKRFVSAGTSQAILTAGIQGLL
jgi:hypothetical protein